MRIFEFWQLHAPLIEYLPTNNPFRPTLFLSQGGRH